MVWGFCCWCVCVCPHVFISKWFHCAAKPENHWGKGRAQWPAPGSCQTRYQFNYLGGWEKPSWNWGATDKEGGGLSSGSLASGGTCHIIFHPLSPESGSYWKDWSSLSVPGLCRVVKDTVETSFQRDSRVAGSGETQQKLTRSSFMSQQAALQGRAQSRK